MLRLNKQSLLLALVLSGCRAGSLTPSPPTDAMGVLTDTALRNYIRTTFTDTSIETGGRHPRDRFAQSHGVATHLVPRDTTCTTIVAYSDGLACVTYIYNQPFRTTPLVVPDTEPYATATAILRRALGAAYDDIGPRTLRNEFATIGSMRCVTFTFREFAKPASAASDSDDYSTASRLLYDFACLEGRSVLSPHKFRLMPGAPSSRSYAALGGVQIWDVFEWRRHRYVLASHVYCAGECEEFEVYRIDGERLVPLGRMFLWSI